MLIVKSFVLLIFILIAWRSIEAIDDANLFSEATNMILIPHYPFIVIVMIAALANALIIFLEISLKIFKGDLNKELK